MDPSTAERVQHVIENRHSSRAPFDPAWHVTEHELAEIIDAARWAPTAHDMQNFRLVAIDDPKVLAELGRIRSPISPQLIVTLGETIAGAPLVILVLYDPTRRAPASDGELLGEISLGCLLENMWLAAQAMHLDVQVIGAIASEGAEPEVRRALGVPPPWRVAFAMRFGHALAKSSAQRVRRNVEAFVGRNRF